jgi:hypothetical protein
VWSEISTPTLELLMQAQNILHHAILGLEHPLTKKFQGFVTAYSNRELYYQGRLSTTTSTTLGPAKLLRYVQLRLVHWYREFHINGMLPNRTPHLKGLLQKLSYGDDSGIPPMPIAYEKAITGNGDSIGGRSSRSSGGSTISDMTRTTASSGGTSSGSNGGDTNPGTSTGRARHLVTNNVGVKAMFGPFLAKINNMKVAEAITAAGSNPPSVTREGETSPMCCVWHLKGNCWANCTRVAGHGAHSKDRTSSSLLGAKRHTPDSWAGTVHQIPRRSALRQCAGG